jgi:hypothetical protein
MRPTPLALAALLLASGCNGLTDDSSAYDLRRAELRRAAERWNGWDVDDYEFRLTRHFGLGLAGPVVVTVIDGEVTKIVDAGTGAAVDPAPFARWDTVEELLERTEEALRTRPDDFEAVYDGGFGYPHFIAVDPQDNAIDEEWGFQVAAFELLPTAQ